MKSCYKFNSNPSTYEEALRDCRKETEGETGDLVSLHNTYEQGEIFEKDKAENRILKGFSRMEVLSKLTVKISKEKLNHLCNNFCNS